VTAGVVTEADNDLEPVGICVRCGERPGHKVTGGRVWDLCLPCSQADRVSAIATPLSTDDGGSDPEGPLMCAICTVRPEVRGGKCSSCQRGQPDSETPARLAPEVAPDTDGDSPSTPATSTSPVDLGSLEQDPEAPAPTEPAAQVEAPTTERPERLLHTITATEEPQRPAPRRVPPPKAPGELRAMVVRLRKLSATVPQLSKDIPDAYDWLYPSGYVPPRVETHERTRRGVKGGDTGDLGTGYGPQESIRRHLSAASDKIARAEQAQAGIAALIRGAAKDLGKAHAAIDRSGPSRDDRPEIIVAPEDRASVAEAKAAQVRRDERIANQVTPWAAEERHG